MYDHLKEVILNGALWQVMLIALLAGVAVSLTTCTLARLPFVVGKSSPSHHGERGALYLALAFSVGLIISYTGIGLLLGGLSAHIKKIAFFSQYIYLFFGGFFMLAGLYFTGLISPLSGKLHDHCHHVVQKINTLPGSFFLGVSFAFLEIPACAGCGAGLLLISGLVAAKGSVIYSIAVFFSFAVGQSLPILVIASSKVFLKKIAVLTEKLEGTISFIAGIILIIVGIIMIVKAI